MGSHAMCAMRRMRADATLRLTSGVRWTPKRRRQGSTLARMWLFQASQFASYGNVFTWTTRFAGGQAPSILHRLIALRHRWDMIARDDDAPHESVMRCWRLCPAWDEMRSFPRS